MNVVRFSPFMNTVVDQCEKNLQYPGFLYDQIQEWLPTQNEDKAEELLQTLIGAGVYASKGSSKRYRLITDGTKREAVIRAIFEGAYKNPNFIINSAEAEANRSFYQKFRVIKIDLSKFLSKTFANRVFKIALCVTVFISIILVGQVFYKITIDLVERRIVPFVINNAPIQAIRIYNFAMDTFDQMYARRYRIILGTLIGKVVILSLPREIPVLTPIARTIDPFFIIPHSIGSFLRFFSYDFCKSLWTGFDEISAFFDNIRKINELERLAICKKEAYALWCEQCNAIRVAL